MKNGAYGPPLFPRFYKIHGAWSNHTIATKYGQPLAVRYKVSITSVAITIIKNQIQVDVKIKNNFYSKKLNTTHTES